MRNFKIPQKAQRVVEEPEERDLVTPAFFTTPIINPRTSKVENVLTEFDTFENFMNENFNMYMGPLTNSASQYTDQDLFNLNIRRSAMETIFHEEATGYLGIAMVHLQERVANVLGINMAYVSCLYYDDENLMYKLLTELTFYFHADRYSLYDAISGLGLCVYNKILNSLQYENDHRFDLNEITELAKEPFAAYMAELGMYAKTLREKATGIYAKVGILGINAELQEMYS